MLLLIPAIRRHFQLRLATKQHILLTQFDQVTQVGGRRGEEGGREGGGERRGEERRGEKGREGRERREEMVGNSHWWVDWRKLGQANGYVCSSCGAV